MHYFMGLYDQPFDLISSGKKTIEVRLNDEKRRLLSEGDMITFSKLTNPLEDVTVLVKKLTVFPTFKALYEAVPSEVMGSKGETIEDMLESTYTIYTPEKEQEWGVLAIEVEKIETD